MRTFVVAVLALLSPALLAQSTYGVHVPAGGGPMPNYFSGTNCRASGIAQIGETITDAYLYINDEKVAEYHWMPPEPQPMSVSLAAMFDSSFFPNGTYLHVKMEVYGLTTGLHVGHAATDPRARNRAILFEQSIPGMEPDPSTTVKAILSGSNYTINDWNGGNWTEADYFWMMDGANRSPSGQRPPWFRGSPGEPPGQC